MRSSLYRSRISISAVSRLEQSAVTRMVLVVVRNREVMMTSYGETFLEVESNRMRILLFDFVHIEGLCRRIADRPGERG